MDKSYPQINKFTPPCSVFEAFQRAQRIYKSDQTQPTIFLPLYLFTEVTTSAITFSTRMLKAIQVIETRAIKSKDDMEYKKLHHFSKPFFSEAMESIKLIVFNRKLLSIFTFRRKYNRRITGLWLLSVLPNCWAPPKRFQSCSERCTTSSYLWRVFETI